MPLPVCVDVNLTVKLVLTEPYSEETRALWAEWESSTSTDGEAHFPPQDEEAALGLLLELPVQVVNVWPYHRDAWRAEIELSIMSRQALAERMPDRTSVERTVTAWETERNQAQASINWRFTTPDARIKLKRLYPPFDS